jgi:hypothetical protein
LKIKVSLAAAPFEPLLSARKIVRSLMSATGEFIRMMNYVDDIAATLRRITVGLPSMTVEERKRLSEYMRKSDPNFVTVLEQLEGGGK